jgi:hypothetical protein
LCGAAGDTAIHVPVNYPGFLPGARGTTYNDQQYGCPITRITNLTAQGISEPATHDYSLRIPFNSNNTKVLLGNGLGQLFVADLSGNVLFSPGGFDVEFDTNSTPLWSNTNPNILYYQKGNQLKKVDLSTPGTPVYSVVHTFSQFASLGNLRHKSNLGFDGDHLLIWSGTNVLGVYTLSTDTLGPTATGFVQGPDNTVPGTGMDYADLTPSNQVLVVWSPPSGTGVKQGTELYAQNMVYVKNVKPTDDHAALGKDINGDDVIVFGGGNDTTRVAPCNPGFEKIDLVTGVKTCLGNFGDFSFNGHVSFYNAASGQYVLISQFDNNSPGTTSCPPVTTGWQAYSAELLLLKIDGSEFRRLAHHRSEVSLGGYSALPKAAISRDAKYAIFSSNYGQNCADLGFANDYVLKIQ